MNSYKRGFSCDHRADPESSTSNTFSLYIPPSPNVLLIKAIWLVRLLTYIGKNVIVL